MKHILLLLLAATMATAKAFSQEGDKDSWEIRKMLLAQVVEWNKGSVDGYMKGYWESDSLVFIGSKGPRYGYNATLQRYKEAYPDADHMGKLTTHITSMQRLSSEYYFIIGSWALTRKAGDVSGSYTQRVRKIKGKWEIVCDHSS